MDWNQIGIDFVMASIRYLLPVLISFMIGYIGLLITNEIEKLKANRPDIIELVKEYAPYLVAYLEQMRKNNKIDLWSIEAETERLVVEFLKTRGVTLDLENPIWLLIKTIIEAEVNKLPNFSNVVTTKTVAKVVESAPSKVFAPVNTSAGKIVDKVVEKGVTETSVITTTTSSSTVSGSSVDVVLPVVGNVSDKDGGAG